MWNQIVKFEISIKSWKQVILYEMYLCIEKLQQTLTTYWEKKYVRQHACICNIKIEYKSFWQLIRTCNSGLKFKKKSLKWSFRDQIICKAYAFLQEKKPRIFQRIVLNVNELRVYTFFFLSLCICFLRLVKSSVKLKQNYKFTPFGAPNGPFWINLYLVFLPHMFDLRFLVIKNKIK